MNDADREEIERIKAELQASCADPVAKVRGHRALSLSASAANGDCKTPEERVQRMAEAIHAQSILLVGFVAGAPKAAADAAKLAVESCPLRSTHNGERPPDTDLLDRPWMQIAKAAFLRSPIALAAVIVALIFRGFGGLMLKALNIA